MIKKAVKITVSLSTNPQVAGRYFVDLRDVSENRNSQMTTTTRDAAEALEFIGQIEGHAKNNDVAVTIEDTTGELVV
jgi:hypothetical protein